MDRNTVNIPSPVFHALRVMAAKNGKGPGIYATEIIATHIKEHGGRIQKPRRSRQRSAA